MGLLGAALTIGSGIAGAISSSKRNSQAQSAISEGQNRNFFETLRASREAAEDRRRFDEQRRAQAKADAARNEEIKKGVGPTLDASNLEPSKLIATSPLGDESEPNIGKRKQINTVA